LRVWNHITEEAAGYPFALSEAVVAAEENSPGILVPIDTGAMVVASDYSGQHKTATHEAYTFLVTSDQDLKEWLPTLHEFRTGWLPDGRSLSYKKLKERVRWKAFPHFLKTVGTLRANVITVMVSRGVGSFFGGTPDQLIAAMPDCFPNCTRHSTVEKMFRHATFMALITAALRREEQSMFWVSDHDETLDSHDRREGFAKLTSYLTHGLTRWQQPGDCWFGTTELEEAPHWAEDLTAIADIFAGCYCEMSGVLPAFFGIRKWLVSTQASVADDRARALGDWLASRPPRLCHLLLRLELDSQGEVRASAQAVVGRGPTGL